MPEVINAAISAKELISYGLLATSVATSVYTLRKIKRDEEEYDAFEDIPWWEAEQEIPLTPALWLWNRKLQGIEDLIDPTTLIDSVGFQAQTAILDRGDVHTFDFSKIGKGYNAIRILTEYQITLENSGVVVFNQKEHLLKHWYSLSASSEGPTSEIRISLIPLDESGEFPAGIVEQLQQDGSYLRIASFDQYDVSVVGHVADDIYRFGRELQACLQGRYAPTWVPI